MRAFTRIRCRRAVRHRLVAACACIAYLLAALPIPLPASIHKDVSQPFPCQNHPCGCQTAEQCWRNCCCFTPEERWAWARANNVEPPAYAAKPVEKEPAVQETVVQGWNTVKLRDLAQAKDVRGPAASRACCAQKLVAKNCCAKETRSACCQKGADASRQESTDKGGRIRWAAAMTAWQCQGLPMLWISLGAVLPVPLPAAWSPDDPPPSAVALTDAIARDIPFDPPAPPPRSSDL